MCIWRGRVTFTFILVEVPNRLPAPLNFWFGSYTLFLHALLFILEVIFHLSHARHISAPLKSLILCEQKCHCQRNVCSMQFMLCGLINRHRRASGETRHSSIYAHKSLLLLVFYWYSNDGVVVQWQSMCWWNFAVTALLLVAIPQWFPKRILIPSCFPTSWLLFILLYPFFSNSILPYPHFPHFHACLFCSLLSSFTLPSSFSHSSLPTSFLWSIYKAMRE